MSERAQVGQRVLWYIAEIPEPPEGPDREAWRRHTAVISKLKAVGVLNFVLTALFLTYISAPPMIAAGIAAAGASSFVFFGIQSSRKRFGERAREPATTPSDIELFAQEFRHRVVRIEAADVVTCDNCQADVPLYMLEDLDDEALIGVCPDCGQAFRARSRA